ncbi:MAG: hypothetical protein ACQES8_03995 [Thermodesulfobacteriota bacterium]
MGYAEAGKKLIREKPQLFERWFDHGGTYKTNIVKTADGKRDALETIRKAMGCNRFICIPCGLLLPRPYGSVFLLAPVVV